MKLYDIGITGGSPYEGLIIVIADNAKQARDVAEAKIQELNKETTHTQYSLNGYLKRRKIKNPMVVHLNTGEI